MPFDDLTPAEQRKILAKRFLPYQKEHEVQGHDVFTKEALTHNPVNFVKRVCVAVGCDQVASVGN